MTLLPLAVFGPLDWGVLLAYFALVTFIAFAVARKDQNAEEYFLGERSIPAWAASLSIVAAMLSAATFVGVPDSSYFGNLSYLSLTFGGFIAVFVVAWLFIPKLYKAGSVTIYGYIAQRFGENARLAVSCAFIFGRLLASGARLFMAAIPVCLLMFGARIPSIEQMILAICLISAVGTFYTTIGGVRAVVWVDVIQLAIVVATALMTIGLLLHQIPLGISGIFHALAQPSTGPHGTSKLHLIGYSLNPSIPYTIWTALIGGTFLYTASFGVDQDMAQRFLVTRSAMRGSLSVIASQIISIVVVVVFLCIGLLLYIFYQRPDLMHATHIAPAEHESIYPWYLLNELPTVLSGISMAGFFAVAQGSTNSAMNALASSIVTDVWFPLRQRRRETSERLVASGTASKSTVVVVGVLLGAFAIVCAIVYDPRQNTLLDFALGVMTFAFTGMLGVFLTALTTSRGNGTSVIVALIVGVLSVVAMQDSIMAMWTPHVFGYAVQLAWPWWMPIGTTLSFACCVAGAPTGGKSEKSLPTTASVTDLRAGKV